MRRQYISAVTSPGLAISIRHRSGAAASQPRPANAKVIIAFNKYFYALAAVLHNTGELLHTTAAFHSGADNFMLVMIII